MIEENNISIKVEPFKHKKRIMNTDKNIENKRKENCNKVKQKCKFEKN